MELNVHRLLAATNISQWDASAAEKTILLHRSAIVGPGSRTVEDTLFLDEIGTPMRVSRN